MSGYKRFFVDCITEVTEITGEEFTHAVSVLRIKKGEKIFLLDNTGKEYVAEISSVEKKRILATLIEESENLCEPKEEILLIAGYLKGDKTELVVQKAVELGVKEIVVFSSAYSSAYMNDNKLERLNRVSLEACKQCGRAKVPKVTYAETLEEALKMGESYNNKLFACEFATKTEVDFNALNGSTAIVVGSEGGFSKEEFEVSKDLGYKTVYLGKRILRAETACIALTAIVSNALKEFE